MTITITSEDHGRIKIKNVWQILEYTTYTYFNTRDAKRTMPNRFRNGTFDAIIESDSKKDK